MQVRRGWVLAAMLSLAVVTGAVIGSSVSADSIPAPPTCPAWQHVRWRQPRHAGAQCVPRPCTSDGACGGGGAACLARRACMVERTRWVSSGGPCVDRDGDDVCDGRRQVTETVERGPCDARGACSEGRCETVRECAAPPTPPG